MCRRWTNHINVAAPMKHSAPHENFNFSPIITRVITASWNNSLIIARFGENFSHTLLHHQLSEEDFKASTTSCTPRYGYSCTQSGGRWLGLSDPRPILNRTGSVRNDQLRGPFIINSPDSSSRACPPDSNTWHSLADPTENAGATAVNLGSPRGMQK